MGPQETEIAVPPERVWETLADPYAYADWVVGARRVRGAGPDWPAVGSLLHHTVGMPPLLVRDSTEVLESVPPSRLVLRAKVRPAGVFRVEIDLEPAGEGTRVRIQEYVEAGPLRLAGPLADAGAQARMTLGLRRLKQLVEARHA